MGMICCHSPGVSVHGSLINDLNGTKSMVTRVLLGRLWVVTLLLIRVQSEAGTHASPPIHTAPSHHFLGSTPRA